MSIANTNASDFFGRRAMSYTLEMHESINIFDKAIERIYTLER